MFSGACVLLTNLMLAVDYIYSSIPSTVKNEPVSTVKDKAKAVTGNYDLTLSVFCMMEGICHDLTGAG
jgi:hypothetical protein